METKRPLPYRAGSPPQTRAEALAARIEERVLAEKLGPGDYLDTLDGLRAASGFARSTVSEAVRLLRERGLLEIRPGRGGGLYVAHANPVIRLRHTLLTVRDAPMRVVDAISVREALEGLIAGDAARYRTDEDVSDMYQFLARMQQASNDPAAFMRANWALHERIADITPNALAGAVYKGTLGFISDASTSFSSDDPAWAQYYRLRCSVHEELVRVIVAGDVDAVPATVARHNH
jgi:GntR family transcriptional regulator, transcriptional repressor for pyruvate dehydrogenase complex